MIGVEMTKKEAMNALRDGKKVKHRSFAKNEWVVQIGAKYKFVDGNYFGIGQ